MHQKERVDEARRLYATGMNVADVARRMHLPWKTVAHWCRGDRRPVGVDRTVCPRCTGADLDEEQYAYLLGQYLGDGHITTSKSNVRCLSIFCADAWPGVRSEVESALAAVLPASKVSSVQRVGCAAVKSYSTHWTCLFPQHGAGRKHERSIVLEQWQQKVVDAHPGQFLRGLVHSDGCRMTNWVTRSVAGELKRYEYPGTSSATSLTTSSHCAARRSTASASPTVGPGGTRCRSRGGRRWPHSTCGSVRSLDLLRPYCFTEA